MLHTYFLTPTFGPARLLQLGILAHSTECLQYKCLSLQVPVSERGTLGRLEHLLAAHARGELPAVPWLDGLTLEVGLLVSLRGM